MNSNIHASILGPAFALAFFVSGCATKPVSMTYEFTVNVTPGDATVRVYPANKDYGPSIDTKQATDGKAVFRLVVTGQDQASLDGRYARFETSAAGYSTDQRVLKLSGLSETIELAAIVPEKTFSERYDEAQAKLAEMRSAYVKANPRLHVTIRRAILAGSLETGMTWADATASLGVLAHDGQSGGVNGRWDYAVANDGVYTTRLSFLEGQLASWHKRTNY